MLLAVGDVEGPRPLRDPYPAVAQLGPARLTGSVPLGKYEHPFVDRAAAGRALGTLLARFAGRDDVLVLGLPRGGVPVAAEIARELAADLDVLLVRKLGVPEQPELAMGAIGAVGGVMETVMNTDIVDRLGIPRGVIDAVYRREVRELHRRAATYRGDRPPVAPGGRVVIVVDDGLATGATMLAAVAAVRGQHPARLIVAVPVGAADSCRRLAAAVDDVVCALTPEPFHAVRQGYRDFSQTSDAEVLAALGRIPGTTGVPGQPDITAP